MLWNLFKSRRVAVGREFKPTRLVLGPWSLLLHRELDAHTFLRQSQGNKLGPTRSSGTINWQSVSRIRCPDTWPPPRSHHTLYFAHIYISAWSPRAFEFVTPSQKGVPGGGGRFLQTEMWGGAPFFRRLKFHWKSVERPVKSFFRRNMARK